ncbi:recombinase family protein [Methylobacterium frigidaeris]|uniref:recombinase family protein n=1 Tax=Methylobacterium frigidaeris TaxID=2038277 RepID=UPI001EDF6CAB|nr:recombinase family protein [Methylobacterium frigidaeris]
MKTALDRFTVKGRETSIRVRQERARQRAADLAPVIEEIRGGATTLQAIAKALNARDIPAPRGGHWTPVQVSRLLTYAAAVHDDGPVFEGDALAGPSVTPVEQRARQE